MPLGCEEWPQSLGNANVYPEDVEGSMAREVGGHCVRLGGWRELRASEGPGDTRTSKAPRCLLHVVGIQGGSLCGAGLVVGGASQNWGHNNRKHSHKE
jgi:hypothetical protein